MKLVSNFTVGRLFDAKIGELVRFTISAGTVLAIVMDKKNTGGLILGVLPSDASKGPRHLEFQVNSKCLNYGSEWSVEPIVQSNTPDRKNLIGTAGVLHISSEESSLCFVRGTDDFDAPDEIEYGLTSEKIVDFPSPEHAVPFVEWKLWASDHDARDPDTMPLYEFSYTAEK